MKNREKVDESSRFPTAPPPSGQKVPYEELEEAIESFQKEHKVDLSEVLKALKKVVPKEVLIPVSVFSEKLSSLETVCKYLKENLNLRYHEIAEVLNRNDRTVWITYRNASGKLKSRFVVKKTRFSIPVSVIANRRLSVLEAIVSYLKDELGLRFTEIAAALHRDQRNIWTVYSRARKKLQGKGKDGK